MTKENVIPLIYMMRSFPKQEKIAYSNKKRTFMEFENISLKEGIRRSKDKTNYILMDVREESRFMEGHLENAISCPYGILKECYEKMRGKKIIVYCDFGGQSMMAARHLSKEGYEVYNIIGGVYYYMEETQQNKKKSKDRKIVDS